MPHARPHTRKKTPKRVLALPWDARVEEAPRALLLLRLIPIALAGPDEFGWRDGWKGTVGGRLKGQNRYSGSLARHMRPYSLA